MALGSACVIAAVVEIVLGHDAKGADGGKHPAFGAVYLVDAIALSHRFITFYLPPIWGFMSYQWLIKHRFL